MRALRVQPMPLWVVDFRQRIVVSLWFLPAIFVAASIALANLTLWLDSVVGATVALRPDLVPDQSAASNLAGAIAAATLAFVAVVFATTLVAIQLAASQYSPRTVRIFIRSRVTRVTLGLFLATFVFALIILVDNRSTLSSATQFAPVVSATTLLALTVATVVGFVAYLHGVVRLMRVQYLLEEIATESRRAVEANFPPESSYLDAQLPPPSPSPQVLGYAGTTGVLTAIDLHGLVEVCRQQDCWVELNVGTGEYLDHGTHFALVHGGELDYRDVTRFFLIRGERTFVQDPGFGFRQLADVAVRALSPAVNDPTTAVQAIDRISDLLGLVGSRPEPTGLLVDPGPAVRVKCKYRGFDEMLTLSLTEIIRYGADAPQVVRRLLAMFDELAATLPVERRTAIDGQRSLLAAATSAALPGPFAKVASVPDRQGLG
jgi:uncharacterized membrane protein